MHQVLDDLEAPVAAQVAADRARRRDGRVGGAGERAEALDHAVALGDDGEHRTGAHELDQRREERLAGVLGVVLGEQGLVGLAQLDGDERVALGLDAADDLPRQAAADAVGLDQDEGALRGGCVSHGRNPNRASGRHGPTAPGWAASYSARSRSIRPPSRSATTHSTTKITADHEHHRDDEPAGQHEHLHDRPGEVAAGPRHHPGQQDQHQRSGSRRPTRWWRRARAAGRTPRASRRTPGRPRG